MATRDLRERLVLWHARGIGDIAFKQISDHFPDFSDFLLHDRDFYHKLGLRQDTISDLNNPDFRMIDDHLEWSQTTRQHLLVYGTESYPKLLQELADPPAVLMVHGSLDCLYQDQIAIVGSRKASFAGLEMSRKIAGELASTGLIVTSGLALGIDGSAHEGALAFGKTIAVMGSGMDQIYPKHHKKLYEKIAEKGAIVSEFPLKTPPIAPNFPRRNRVISGLSLGVVVIEAAKRSGSLITARLALEQNREVMALPGIAMDVRSCGCNALIKEGAHLVENYQDVLHILGREFNEYDIVIHDHASDSGLITCIDRKPTPLDLIKFRSKLETKTLIAELMALELAGMIRQVPGGYERK